MTEHPHDPHDPPVDPVQRTGAPLDPKELRRRHHGRQTTCRGAEFLRAMTQVERRWMTAMVGVVAREHGVDGDELLQDLQLGLLQNDAIDAGRSDVRGWLRRRARWKAKDLLRKERAARCPGGSLDDLPVDPPACEPHALADPGVSRSALEKLGLNRDEAQVVLLHIWGLDLSLQEFADRVSRSYAKVRQDRSRGMKKIKILFDLEPDEYTAYVTKLDCRSAVVAAAQLGWTRERTELLVRRAERKIALILERLREPEDTRDGNDPDAL